MTTPKASNAHPLGAADGYADEVRPTCDCGSHDAYWHRMGTLALWCCDQCWPGQQYAYWGKDKIVGECITEHPHIKY